jgi:hypothetical protein
MASVAQPLPLEEDRYCQPNQRERRMIYDV